MAKYFTNGGGRDVHRSKEQETDHLQVCTLAKVENMGHLTTNILKCNDLNKA